ncbi:MAG TPA: hypothetical protein VIJ20_12790 [Solirubrobacteraceae bacterium]
MLPVPVVDPVPSVVPPAVPAPEEDESPVPVAVPVPVPVPEVPAVPVVGDVDELPVDPVVPVELVVPDAPVPLVPVEVVEPVDVSPAAPVSVGSVTPPGGLAVGMMLSPPEIEGGPVDFDAAPPALVPVGLAAGSFVVDREDP